MGKLAKCKNCGAHIDKKLKTCPICNAKQKRRIVCRRIGVYFLVFFGLIIFGVILFQRGEDGKTIIPNWFYPFCYIFPAVIAVSYDSKILNTFISKLQRIDDPLGEHIHKKDNEVDALYTQAVNVVFETGQASGSMLQRRLSISWDNSQRLLSQMESDGIVGPFDGSTPRKILIDKNTWAINRVQNTHIAKLTEIDAMGGHEFEYWCADLLRKIGFVNVDVTQGSGDQGVDILAEKDGIKYAIQCKCYSSDLGNKPIQEVHTGKAIYHCQIGAVITNRHFTQGGKDAAKATGVLLWDRDWIQKKLMESTK